MDAPPTTGAPADRPVAWRRALRLAALGPLGWGLLHLARLRPDLTERWYARGLYPRVRGALAWLQGWTPVSLAELSIGGLAALVAWRAGRALAALRRGRRLGNVLAHAAAQGLAALGVLGLAFQLSWGLNHARPTLARLLDLPTGPVRVQELRGLVLSLATQAALDRPLEDGAPASGQGALDDAWAALGRRHAILAGEAVRPRDALGSRLLTWAGLTGIFSPFTGEPHVNREMPRAARPFTVCHELAHQRGIAREDEANFVAWLVCSESSAQDQRYSGNLLALSHALVAWHRVQPEAARAEFAGLDEAVKRDLIGLWEFWRRERTLFTQVAKGTNDLFLKGQGQQAGARSYGRMVDLLVAWQRSGAD